MFNLIKRNQFFVHSFFVFSGLVFIYLMISNNLVSSGGIILKNDYIDQHIPFYEEFYRLLTNGLPFWSWNSFLGSDFWSSKIYYLVGDLYAWLGYLLYLQLENVIRVLTRLLYLKFFVGFLSFYLLQVKLKQSALAAFIFSLFYVFMGWNTTFLEHPSYTSLFSVLPLLFLGVEQFIQNRKFTLFSLAVFLLVSMNFYLFWIVSLMLLVYWLMRYILYYETFKMSKFIIDSLKLLMYFLLGLGLASIFVLPGVIYLLQSSRMGSYLFEFDSWSLLNIASFITFSLIPRLAYFNTGLFKDHFYYFEQISIYFGLLPLMLIPHSFYVFEKSKEKIIYSAIVLFLPLLLLSPKIGIFFHFTYSLRYTLFISFFGLIIASFVFTKFDRIKISIVLITQLIISLSYYAIIYYFIPTIYTNGLPSETLELDLLHKAHVLSLAFSFLLTLFSFFVYKNYKNSSNYFRIGIVFLSLLEIYINTPYVLSSQVYENDYFPEYYNYTDFQDAVNYIKDIDDSLFRVEHNGMSFTWYRFENISLVDDFHSTITYDSVWQYPLNDFLK